MAREGSSRPDSASRSSVAPPPKFKLYPTQLPSGPRRKRATIPCTTPPGTHRARRLCVPVKVPDRFDDALSVPTDYPARRSYNDT